MTGDIQEISLEDLVEEIQKAKGIIEEIEAQKSVLQDEILLRLRKMGLDGTKTKNGYLVTRISKVLFTGVTVGQARELGATVMEEKIDSGKLRELYNRGVKIAGVKISTFVNIKEAK